jgi:hypothetical protein
LAICFVLPFAVACAANTVKPVAEVHSASLPPPPLVLVYDPLFHDSGVAQSARTVGVVMNTYDGHYPRGELGKHAAHVFAVELVKSISKLGLRAERAGRDTPVPPNAVVVVGQLLDVKKGDNFERLVVGFGAGQSRIDMRVLVYDMGEHPVELLEFKSHADSGRLPGSAITLGAGAAATGGLTAVAGVGALVGGGIKSYRYPVEQLAKRSAKHATAYMSQYFARQGWIAQNSVKKPSPLSHVLDVW